MEDDDDPPSTWIGVPILWDVQESGELLAAVNDINRRLAVGRAAWDGKGVAIFERFPNYVLSIQGLRHAFDEIGRTADYFDDVLRQRFGGSTPGSDADGDGPVDYL